MDSKHVEEKIEALLFYKVSPIAIGELAEVLSLTSDEVHIGLDALEQSLVGRGIQLMRSGNNVALATAPAASATIEKSRREELARDLGKAALETLAIVLYRAPVARSGIDYIRGVNSTFTLRNLLVRGLIERVPNP
jgi:segregation and condensation protein B